MTSWVIGVGGGQGKGPGQGGGGQSSQGGRGGIMMPSARAGVGSARQMSIRRAIRASLFTASSLQDQSIDVQPKDGIADGLVPRGIIGRLTCRHKGHKQSL